LVEVAETGETLYAVGVEGGAGGGGVVAGVVGLPLVGCASHCFVDAAVVDQVVVGRVAAVEAEASEGIKGAASRTDIQTASKVEVLSWGTSSISNARSIDEIISWDAKGANSSDSIVTCTRKPVRSNGLGATLEVGVEVSEARIIRAGVCIAVEGNSCLVK
jgi:hypothetical protein